MKNWTRTPSRNYTAKSFTAAKAESLGYYDASMGNPSDHGKMKNEKNKWAYVKGYRTACRATR